MRQRPPKSTRTDSLFPYTTLFRSKHDLRGLPRPKDAVGKDPMLGLRLRMTPSDRLMQRLGSYIEMHLFKGGYLGVVLQETESANFCMAVRKSRSEERRVGQECVRPCRYRWSPDT